MAAASRFLPYVGFVSLAAAGGGYLVQSKTVLAKDDDGGSGGLLVEPIPSRAQQLSRLRGSSPHRPFDVLIIGGGATGAGCAVDAATRGLRTALVEREDFASGTSSKSTKLVHGGVRYLEKAFWKLDIGALKLVFEALRERRALLDNAPHLTAALPILTPCYSLWEVPYFWAGLKAYDLVAGLRNLTPSRYLGPEEALRQMPTLASVRPDGSRLRGAIQYFDGQFDDARLNVALATTAAAAGAVVSNYAEVRRLIKNEGGQVIGAVVSDRLGGPPAARRAGSGGSRDASGRSGDSTRASSGSGSGSSADDVEAAAEGDEIEVYAKVVVNATGPFSDALRAMADPAAPPTILASAGAHLTLPAYVGSPTTGMIVPKTKDGRVVFVIPWLDRVIAGTTDEKCDVTDRPAPSEAEVDFILDVLNDFLAVRLGRGDVLSAWSGIRPLAVDPRAADTATASRDHLVLQHEAGGLITITGGKWTTYRLMAQDTINAAVATGRLPANVRPCATEGLKLLGGRRYTPTMHAELAQHQAARLHAVAAPTAAAPADAASASSSSSARSSSSGSGSSGAASTSSSSSSSGDVIIADPAVLRHLVAAYGDKAPGLLQLAEERRLGRPLAAGHPVIEAEVVHCVRHEYCATVTDFIARRSRLAFLDAEAAQAALPRVAELMGGELGWTQERRYQEAAAARQYLRACFAVPGSAGFRQ